MSDGLRAIAARYAAGLRAVSALAPMSDEARLEALRMVMRYGLVMNHLVTILELQKRRLDDLTPEEWDEWFTGKARHNLKEFGGEESVVGYVTHSMAWLFPDLPRLSSGVWAGKALDESALPEVLRRFRELPGAVQYGFTK